MKLKTTKCYQSHHTGKLNGHFGKLNSLTPTQQKIQTKGLFSSLLSEYLQDAVSLTESFHELLKCLS